MSEIAAPRAHSRKRLKRVLAVLAVAGPGLIAANAGNDAGGILTYASAGAQFAYRTLFLMVLVTVALVVVQEMCERLGAYTHKGLGGLIREQFPLRASVGAMLLLFVANAGLTVSEFAGIGAAMELLGVSRYFAVPIALVAIWAITVFGNYTKAERAAIVLSLAFIAYPIAALMAHPDWGHSRSRPCRAPLRPLDGVPRARCRTDRDDDYALHAVLCRLGGRRQGDRA